MYINDQWSTLHTTNFNERLTTFKDMFNEFDDLCSVNCDLGANENFVTELSMILIEVVCLFLIKFACHKNLRSE